MSELKFIQIERPVDDIGIIIINRPEVMNAINIDVIGELSSAIDIVGMDESIKVVIITGKGERSFCAGADIRYVANINPIEAERYASLVHAMLNKIENLEKPVVAAINGYALGGGGEIALACDIRIASSNAKIGQTEVKIGIPPGWGGTQRMLRILGPAKTKELIFTGEMISANEALSIGLVNKVINIATVSKGEDTIFIKQDEPKLLNEKLMAECINLGQQITRNSYNAVIISKMLTNKAIDADIQTGLRLEIYGWALCFAHEDRQKRMSKFLNKGREK